MPDQRPSPEQLLQAAQEEEKQAGHGKLKIYLGAAPGVGKTYMMLQDAIAKRAQGLDVIVGVVESHGRVEIEKLLASLDKLPLQNIDYRGKVLTEFDIDTALKRTPGLILMDEMAHTNAPGLRHNKRWQDIKELLDRGIDVYTTLNVQHIESLNDVVSQIIHAQVKETIPDHMLELAETIELVDLPPEDLIKRLQEGKVYLAEQAALAGEHFFRKGNLIALRELALRVTAERVGAQVLLYRQGQGIRQVWPTRDKILVCVGPRMQTTKLIRAARRMATNMQADWMAVYVETPRFQRSEQLRNNAILNLRFAEELGAETEMLTGFNAVSEILSFAREQNITKLFVGKPVRPRWRDIIFGSFSDELIRHSGEIDVYIISGQLSGESSQPKKSASPVKAKAKAIPWKIYGVSVAMIALATFINHLISPYLHAANFIMIYVLGVTLVAIFGQVGPSILASILSVVAYGYFFTPFYYTLLFNNLEYALTFVVMLLVTQIISHLTILTRRQAELARLSQQRTANLHSLSRQLASTRGVNKLLDTALRYLSQAFDCECLALLPENNHLVVSASYKAESSLNSKEQGVAQWVYDLGQPAGLGTDTLPFSDAVYVPLLTARGTIGVLRIRPIQTKQLLTPEQMHLLEACTSQIALAIEVDRLQEQKRSSEVQNATDVVRNALLKSVSHDLRSPLIAAMGGASTLIEMASQLDSDMIRKLAENIYLETEQASRLINNLLQMTYLEGDEVKLLKENNSLNEVINLVLKSLNKELGKKPVSLHLPADLPLVPLDKVLIEEVISSLIDNAIKYSPPSSAIDITASQSGDRVIVSIEDRGPGIVPDEVNKLFEKFYRGRMLATQRGLGLGLAICRRIINAHGGEIWAANRKDGGAAFRFSLPLKS